MTDFKRNGTPNAAACSSDIAATSLAVGYHSLVSFRASSFSASPGTLPMDWQAISMASSMEVEEKRVDEEVASWLLLEGRAEVSKDRFGCEVLVGFKP